MPTDTGKQPIKFLPYYNTYGLVIYLASNTAVAVTDGQTRDELNTFDMVLDSGTVVNTAVNGVNGLDTGSLGASNLYYVFVIGDSSLENPVATLMSLSATAPVMPTGYDLSKRIGQVITDGSSHFVPFAQSGIRSERTYTYDSPQLVLNAGAQITTFASVALGAAVPAGSTHIALLQSVFIPTATTSEAKIRPGYSVTTSPIYISGIVAAVAQVNYFEQTSSSGATIEYVVSANTDSLSIFVVGYRDSI